MIFIIGPVNQFSNLKRIIRVVLCFIIASQSILASASPIGQKYHTSQEIKETAKIFLEKIALAADNPAIEIEINDLDPRLKLRMCDEPLDTYIPTGSKRRGKMTVAVSCRAPVAWKVFIGAEVAEYADVIVASKSLARKTLISKNDITHRRVNISSLRKIPLLESQQAIGSKTKRNIRNNALVYQDSICMVCRGDNVQIIAKNEFFSINMEAIALEDAGIGEMTLVRNTQSKRSFSAKVISKDQLVVNL